MTAGERLSRRRAGWLLAAIVLTGALLWAVPLWWGIPQTSPATWAFDEMTPRHVAWSWTNLYPPAHRHLLGGVIGATRLLAELTPLAQPGPVQLLLVSRATSVVLAGLIALVIYRCARRLSGRGASLLSVTAVVFGTNYVFYAKTANLDIPYLFWFSLSLLFFLRCLQKRRWYDYVLFAACGALAIATKTQAYALYLLAPVALVNDLRPAGAPFPRGFGRALLDRRILEAAGAFVAVTLLVFGEPWRSGLLRAHLESLASVPFDEYRTLSLSPRALLTTAADSLRLTSFVLGAPMLVASLLGLGMSLARPRRNALRLATLLVVAPYWLAFIFWTGFNYDRHYLPIALVLGLFAGPALARLAAPGPPLRPLRLAALGLALAYSLCCGASVDLMLLGDARYEAERWMVDNSLLPETAGLGSSERLPRWLPAIPVEEFARSRRGEHGTNPRVWHNCLALAEIDTEYLIPDTPWEMRGPGLNYREYRRFRNAAPMPLINPEGIAPHASNVVKPTLDVVVFRRTDEECVDSAAVPRALHELRRDNDPALREQLARAILESPAVPSLPLNAIGLVGVRLHGDGWTAGTQPAGIAAWNLGQGERRPVLRLRLSRPKAPYPLTVFVDDGEGTRSLVFASPGEKVVQLPAVAPGRRSLAILWTDQNWTDQTGATRGIRVLAASWAGDPEEPPSRLDAVLGGLGRRRPGTTQRAALVRAARSAGMPNPMAIDESALLVGAWNDGWTIGTEPAALLVGNPRQSRVRVDLLLGCSAPATPVIVHLEGGEQPRRLELDCRAHPSPAPLDPLAPGAERIYVLRAERAHLSSTEPKRLLGVRVLEVRLVPLPG